MPVYVTLEFQRCSCTVGALPDTRPLVLLPLIEGGEGLATPRPERGNDQPYQNCPGQITDLPGAGQGWNFHGMHRLLVLFHITIVSRLEATYITDGPLQLLWWLSGTCS